MSHTAPLASLGFADPTCHQSGRSRAVSGGLTVSDVGYHKLKLKHIAY